MKAKNHRASNRKSTVLIVEDSRTQLEQLEYLLTERGYKVKSASNGRQALSVVRKFTPSLVISDVVMPEMDGYTLCEELKSRKRFKDVPVILLTSLSSAQDVIKGLQCGADNFVRKPYDQKYLLSRIEHILTNRELRNGERVQMGVEIYFGGQRHFISSERQQILDLLISTYEQAVQMNDELAVHNQSLERSSQFLRTLYGIAKSLNKSTTEKEVAEKVTEAAMQLPGVRGCWLCLREGKSDFRLVGSANLPPELQATGALEGDCRCRRKLLSGELVRSIEMLECERLKTAADASELRHHATIPLWCGEEILGVLNLAESESDLFTEEDLQTLNGVGNQIGAALERARLYEELENKVQERTEALRISAEKYRGIFENAVEGIFQSTPGGRFLSANPAMARLLGYDSPEELIAGVKDITHQLYVDPTRRDFVTHLLEDQGVIQVLESEVYRKDGSKIWISENSRTVRDSMGEVQYYEGSIEDVTNRKRMEEERSSLEDQLRQAQKLEAIGQLAGGVAHDFNNLLMAISGYSELLLMTISEDPVRKNVLEIRKATEQGARLTRQLLAFSRKQVLSPQILNLNQSITNMQNMLHRLIGEDIQLSCVLADDLGHVKADPGQIEQIVMNLAVNARDAMPQGGKLTIETTNTELDERYGREHVDVKPGPYVMLAITDNGSGMAQATLSHIFEPFFTTKGEGKGTGLGLSTVYGIVKQSGGHINVYSHPGQGTTFKVYLPRTAGQAQPSANQTSQVDLEGHGEVILLVDDNESIRRALSEVLRMRGYIVLEAESGADAIEKLRDQTGPIHLIITDVVMPEMSGRELIQRVESDRPGTKVLFMSGYSDEAIKRHGILGPGATFLQKPASMQVLLGKIRELVNQKEEKS